MTIDLKFRSLILLFLVHSVCVTTVFAYSKKLSTIELKRIENKIQKLSNSFLAEMDVLKKKGLGTDGQDAADTFYKYAKRLVLFRLDTLHPDDLSTLAIWAEGCNPTFSASYVYEYVFESCVHKLGTLRSKCAREALKRVKLAVKKRGHLDGHIGETIAEAEEASTKK